MTSPLPYPPPWMDLATLAAHTCLSESTIEAMVRRGALPQPRNPSGGKRLWRWKDIDKALAGETESASAEVKRITDATRQALSASRNIR